MRNISGVYGANIPRWGDNLWYLIDLADFKWAVVRTDCDPSVAKKLHTAGIEVIMQMPDGFNQNLHLNPGKWTKQCLERAHLFQEFSNIICLDNEPNLIQCEQTTWYAEQFCRWYRAILAIWRFYDPAGYWKVLFPALSPTKNLLPEMWFKINEENIRESDALAAHSYWPDAIPPGNAYSDTFYQIMHDLAPDKDIYILEYGSPNTKVGDRAKAAGYNTFLTLLPDYVKCACAFILGGTEDWRDWFITETIAQKLGEP